MAKRKGLNQRERVHALMSDRSWWTLNELADACDSLFGRWDTPAAISARLREMGAEKRRRGGKGNLWEYRLF